MTTVVIAGGGSGANGSVSKPRAYKRTASLSVANQAQPRAAATQRPNVFEAPN